MSFCPQITTEETSLEEYWLFWYRMRAHHVHLISETLNKLFDHDLFQLVSLVSVLGVDGGFVLVVLGQVLFDCAQLVAVLCTVGAAVR